MPPHLVDLSASVDLVDDGDGVSHGEPSGYCEDRTIVAVLTVVVVVHTGDDDIAAFDDAPAVVLGDDEGVALDASLIALFVHPVGCVDVIVGEGQNIDGVAGGVDQCVVYAQAQGVGFIGLFHGCYLRCFVWCWCCLVVLMITDNL